MTTFYHKSKPSSVIRVTGEDAEDYLQSQWTLNVKKLASNSIGYGLRLSTKGKVLLIHIFRLGEEGLYSLVENVVEKKSFLYSMKIL